MVGNTIWDPVLFPEPEVLRPERHLNADGQFVKNENITPFGVGKLNFTTKNPHKISGHCLDDILTIYYCLYDISNAIATFHRKEKLSGGATG